MDPINRVQVLAEAMTRHRVDSKTIPEDMLLCRCGESWTSEHPYEVALLFLDIDYQHVHDTPKQLHECCVTYIEESFRSRLLDSLKAEAYKSLEAGESPVALGIMNVIIQIELGLLP